MNATRFQVQQLSGHRSLCLWLLSFWPQALRWPHGHSVAGRPHRQGPSRN